MSETWYVSLGGDPSGPAKTETVIDWIRNGELALEAQICRVGESEWQSLRDVPELAEVLREVAPVSAVAPPKPPSIPPAPPDVAYEPPPIAYEPEPLPTPEPAWTQPARVAPPAWASPHDARHLVAPQAPAPTPPPASDFTVASAAMPYAINAPGAPKSRLVFILLGLVLGMIGVHNFYAGYTKRGMAQIFITLASGWMCAPLVLLNLWIYAELFFVTKDANGEPFT